MIHKMRVIKLGEKLSALQWKELFESQNEIHYQANKIMTSALIVELIVEDKKPFLSLLMFMIQIMGNVSTTQ